MSLDTLEKPIIINVGGELFTANKSTLIQSKFIAAILMANNKEEVIFIDRDNLLFRKILNCMRDNRYYTDEISKELKNEMDYYNINLISPKITPVSCTVFVTLPHIIEGVRVTVINGIHSRIDILNSCSNKMKSCNPVKILCYYTNFNHHLRIEQWVISNNENIMHSYKTKKNDITIIAPIMEYDNCHWNAQYFKVADIYLEHD